MSTILFVPFPERGHINPSLKLARELQDRGHRIIYCCIRDTEELIRSEGFGFECLFEDAFPKGFQKEVAEQLGRLRGRARFAYLRELVRRQTRMLDALLEGEFDAIIARTRPVMGITDVLLAEAFLVLHGHGVPALRLDTSLPLQWEPMTPPPTSHHIPDGGALSRLRIAWQWGRVRLSTRLAQGLHHVGLEPDALRYRRQLARKHGFPVEELDFSGRPVGARSPMLVLCPREFAQFRGASTPPEFIYTGPSIDLRRKEPDFPWEQLDGDKPLVVCSLGTMPTPPERARRFHHSVIEAARQRPRWQFVVSTNRWQPEESTGPAPANLVTVQHLPQLQLLRRAAAMLTHGGFNSVKECIAFGVPMVVMPVQFDQPGVAARVAHHGLGVRTSIDTLTPDGLTRMLDEVVEKPSYRQAMQQMQALFLAAERDHSPVDAIQQRIQQPSNPRMMGGTT